MTDNKIISTMKRHKIITGIVFLILLGAVTIGRTDSQTATTQQPATTTQQPATQQLATVVTRADVEQFVGHDITWLDSASKSLDATCAYADNRADGTGTYKCTVNVTLNGTATWRAVTVTVSPDGSMVAATY